MMIFSRPPTETVRDQVAFYLVRAAVALGKKRLSNSKIEAVSARFAADADLAWNKIQEPVEFWVWQNGTIVTMEIRWKFGEQQANIFGTLTYDLESDLFRIKQRLSDDVRLGGLAWAWPTYTQHGA